MPPATPLGEKIRAAREAAMWTREELAARSGISTRTIAAVELGTATPRLSTLAALYRTLGIDPGEPLADHASEAGQDRLRPHELPPAHRDLVGRSELVARASATLVTDDGDATSPRILAISGPPGAGKTTLAVHIAHAIADDFPDGQYYLSFADAAYRPDALASALHHLLVGSGLHPAAMPHDAAARAAAWRSRVAGARVLVVLDDVPDDLDLAPLLPGTGPSAVVLTSRRHPLSLPDAASEVLHGLDARQGLALLEAIVGVDAVADDLAAAREIVRLSDHLPGAVRMSAARVNAAPSRGLSEVAVRLRNEHARLDLLSGTNFGVRASLRSAADDLPPRERDALEVIGALGATAGPVWTVAGALDWGLAETEAVVHALSDAHLVDWNGFGVEAQYSVHGLTRLFAAEEARRRAEAEQDAWWRRLMELWGSLVLAGADALGVSPGIMGPGAPSGNPRHPELVRAVEREPAAWFTRNAPVLVAHSALALGHAPTATVWRVMAQAQPWWLLAGLDPGAERLIDQLAQRSAEEGDEVGRATMLTVAAMSTVGLEDFDRTQGQLRWAQEVFREANQPRGEFACALGRAATLSRAYNFGGDEAALARAHEQALEAVRIARELADPGRESDALRMVAIAARASGDLVRAREAATRSLELVPQTWPQAVAQVEWLLAMIRYDDGDPAGAIPGLQSALRTLESIGDAWGSARVQLDLGRALIETGETAQALWHVTAAEQRARVIGHAQLAEQAEAILNAPLFA